jgi:RIO-like serine/threonine protein kinase
MTQTAPNFSRRIVTYDGQQVLQKQASCGLARALLENEARVLAQLAGLGAPAVVCVAQDKTVLTLCQEFIHGATLMHTPLHQWPSLLEQLKISLQSVHARGLVHGDLKPSNLIVSQTGLRAIDWEHALPIGAQIAGLPLRAVSLGMSDPNLIWGRGTVSAAIDHYSIERMSEMAADPNGHRIV